MNKNEFKIFLLFIQLSGVPWMKRFYYAPVCYSSHSFFSTVSFNAANSAKITKEIDSSDIELKSKIINNLIN